MALSEHAKIYLKNKYGTTNTKRVTTSVDPLADWNKRWEEIKNGSGVPAVQGGTVTITPDLQIQQQAQADFEAALQAQQEIYNATGFANLRDVNAMNLPTVQHNKDWTAAQEEELAKMRDELMNTGRIQREFIGTGIEYNPNVRQGTQTEEDLFAAYQEQLAKRNAASPNATSGFMPVDPTKQTVGTYAAESGLAGLVGSLEGSRNFVVDLAAENARNDMYELLASQSASAVDPTALIDAQRAAGISTQPQIDPNVLETEIRQHRDTSASRAMQERLADYNVNPQSAVGIAGNVAAGVGGMLPAIGANLLVLGSGSAVMFSSAAGQAASEALANGADYDEAFTYGVVSGATEIATEKILGGIPGLNEGWADDLLNKGIARISTSPVGRFLIKTGVDALGEGFEEWLSEAIGQYTVRIYDEDERNRTVGEVWNEGRSDRLYSALIGALTSLAMQAPTVNANNVAQYNAELTKIRGGIENALVEEGMTAQEAQQTAAAMVEQAQTEIATTTPTQTAQTEAQQTTDMLSAETPQTGVQQPTQQQIEDELVSMVTGEPVPSERLVTVNGEQIERADVDFKPTQKVAAVKRLGNAFGKQVVFVKGFSNGANGATDGNRIFISETTRNPYIEVFNHELTHTLRGAGSWNGFQSYVLEQIRAEKGKGYDAYVQELRKRYADRGVTLDTTLLNEELVADFVERRLFTDQTAVNELVRQQESVAYRIWSMLRDAVRQLNKNTRLSPEEMAIKKAERMFAKALAQSNNSNIQSSSLKYSIRSMKADLSDGAMQRALTEEREINGVKLPPVFTQEEANRFVENLDHLMDKILPKAKFLDLNETYTKKNRPFNPVKPNSDPLYRVSLDFSTVCKKRIVTQMVMEHLNAQLGRALSSETQYAITQRLRELQTEYSELQVACAICYVEAARLKSPKVINQFLGDRRSAITNYYASKNEENRAAARDAAAQVKIAAGYDADTPNKNLPANVKKAATNASRSVRENYVPSEAEEAQISAAEIMDSSVFLTADGLTNLAINNHDVYDAFVSKVRSATRSKSIETSVPYYYGDSEAMMPDTLIEQMNRENGMRYQSWSDFELKHLLDNIMAVAEMSARNAKMHSYTKVPEFVIVNGKTGMMINLSLIPEGKTGIDADGNLLFSSTEGMPRETANSLRDTYHETAGTIAIGVSDEQIVKLLESEDIDYVIPYHISGLNKALRKIAKIHEWKDYTGSQNEKAVKGSFQGEKPKFSDWFNDALLDKAQQEGWSGVETMQQAAESYKRMCIERGYTPKFPQFMEEPNYWKLLIDRRMVDGQGNIIIQQAVRPNFEFERIGEIVDAAEDPNTDELVNEILGIVYREAQTGGITRISNKATVRGEEAEIAELGRKFSESLENQPQITQFSISDPNADGRQRNEIDIDAALAQSRRKSTRDLVANNTFGEQQNSVQGQETQRTAKYAPNTVGAAQSKAVKSGTGDAARVLPNDATYETANNVLAIVDPQMMELGERIKSGFRELYRYTVSGQAALEYADKAQGSDSVINAVTQLARQAGGTVDTICESMLVSPDPGEGAKPLDVSYNEIIQMVPREQWSDYNDYRQHLHNIDRMSLRDELAVESAVDEYNAFIAENPEYETYADSYIQKLAKTGGDGNPASVYLALKEAVDEANAKVNKPVVGKSDGTPYTAAESAEIVAEYDKAHPEWREYVNRQNKWWDNAMHAWLVDSGLITEDAYQTMRQMYPNYIPTYRVEGKSGSSPVYGNRIKAKPVGKAEGGVSPIIPLEEQFIKQINKIVRQERLNEIGIELLNFARQNPQAAATSGIALKTDVQDGLVDAVTADSIYNEADEVKGLRQLEDGTYTFTVMEQGKPVVLNVSKEVYESIDWLRTSGLGEIATKITKLFGGISNPIKSGITGYNPLFIISNFVRDIQTYAVNSTKGGSHWVSNYFKAAQEILKKGDQYNELKALGGLRSGYYNSKEGYTATLPKNTTWDKVKRIAGTPIRGIENISQFIESIPRMAEYMNVIEKEGNTPEGRKRAALASQDVTTNFTRNAPVSKVANSFVLYLNASIQGIDKTVRQIKSKPGQTLAGAGLSVALPSIILAIVNAANPNYDELDERTKDQYYCIPNLFGERDEEGYAKTFFKFPRSREYGVVLGASFDRLLRGLETKEWGEAFDGILAQAWTNFAPPDIMQDNLWSMAARVDLFDEDSPGETWYGGDIVPSRLQDLPPEMQYDVNTSNLAKNIGQATGLSPKKIDNIIDSYGGYAADLLLAATSPKNEGANFGESVWNTFDSTFLMPAERRFTADPRYSSGVVDDFYDAYDEITKEANAMNYTEDFPIAIKTPSEVAKSAMTSIASAMSDLYAKEREVWASTGSLRDKQREADAIREQINELASEYEESVRVKMEKQQEIIDDLADILTEQGFYDYARAAGGENNEITQEEAKQILDDMDELSLEEKKRVWKLTGLMLKEAGWKKEYSPN